ncbi:MAG: Flp pilus assembly protein CpaB [Rhodospirillaceae bacterium]
MVRVVLIGFALLLAAAAGWMVKLYLSAQREQLAEMAAALKPAPTPSPGTEVLVVRDGIDIAGVLSPGTLRWQLWPDEGVNPRYITRKARPDAIDKLAGAAARQPFYPGEPVTEEKLVQKKDGSFLAAVLPEGGRAVAVKVDEATGLSGLVLPGDRVDVILTHDLPLREDDGQGGVTVVKRFVSEVIARDLPVVAIDQEIHHDDKAAGRPAKTVSLAVTPAQAETIALGRVMGTLSLSLRSAFGGNPPDPRARAYTSGSDVSAALGRRAAPPVRTATAYSVTVYHGRSAETVTLAR